MADHATSKEPGHGARPRAGTNLNPTAFDFVPQVSRIVQQVEFPDQQHNKWSNGTTRLNGVGESKNNNVYSNFRPFMSMLALTSQLANQKLAPQPGIGAQDNVPQHRLKRSSSSYPFIPQTRGISQWTTIAQEWNPENCLPVENPEWASDMLAVSTYMSNAYKVNNGRDQATYELQKRAASNRSTLMKPEAAIKPLARMLYEEMREKMYPINRAPPVVTATMDGYIWRAAEMNEMSEKELEVLMKDKEPERRVREMAAVYEGVEYESHGDCSWL